MPVSTATPNANRIAVIPGDGIGKEVVPEGLRVLEAAAKKYNLDLRFDDFDFANCDYYARHGQMMPDDWKAQIETHDAIFFGAVGWPETVPDHISVGFAIAYKAFRWMSDYLFLCLLFWYVHVLVLV